MKLPKPLLAVLIMIVVGAVLVTAHYEVQIDAQEDIYGTPLPTADEVLQDDDSFNVGSFVFGFVGGVTVGAMVLYIHLRKDKLEEQRKKKA